MSKIAGKKSIRILVAVLICLVIVAVPLTAKLVADNIINAPDSEQSVPGDNVEDGTSGDTVDKPSSGDTAVPKDIRVTISIGAKALFREQNTRYLHKIKESMGEELFSALNNGEILPSIEVVVPRGATVKDVTLKATQEAGIDVSNSSTYIYAIAGLGEKMAGANSGWVFTIDSKAVNVGMASVHLVGGENIEWKYIVG